VHGLVLPVAGASSFPAITIDGRLQLRRRAEVLLLALVRVQILHVSARCEMHKIINKRGKHAMSLLPREMHQGKLHVDVLFKLNYRVNTKATGKQITIPQRERITDRLLLDRCNV